MNDRDLISRLKEGDEQSYKELVDKFEQQVFSICYGFVHDREMAEDIAQEVFIQVFKSIGKFRGESQLSTWIYRICVNRSINAVRRKKNNLIQRLDDWFSEDEPTSSNTITPDKELENKEKRLKLNEAIDHLPSNQRKTFLLSRYQGLSNKEVAEVMNTTVSAIESLLFRAKQNLQKSLTNFYYNK